MSAPTAARRVTPTAVRVLPADADRDTWLDARRQGIGSSDVAAILGLADRRTPLHVWHDKRGELVDQDNEYALWGRVLEEPVAREWARRNRSVIARVGLIANVDSPWAMATLDRRVAECPLDRSVRTACALEVKTRNAWVASRWRSDVPDDVLAQVVWQMEVTGYDHVHVAVLIGGNDYRQAVVRRDLQVATYILGEVKRFRDEHMVPGVPPEVEVTAGNTRALLDLDEALHQDRVGELTIEDLGEVLDYARLSAEAGAATRRLKAARAVLGRIADGRRYITCDNNLAYEFAPVERSTCDLAALAERWPEAYADCVTTKSHYQIRLSRELRQRSTDDDQ